VLLIGRRAIWAKFIAVGAAVSLFQLLVFFEPNLLVGVGIDVAILAGLVFRRYRRDMAAARALLDALARRTIATTFGPLEYVETGAGSPVLLVHGVFGGCDHGLVLAEMYVGQEFRTISPSRFGYLGSPLPKGGDSGRPG
jgi:hypothetical protein